LNLLENDTQFYSSERSDIENKIQYHLKLITSETNNIIFIITKLVKFIDNFVIEGNIKKVLLFLQLRIFYQMKIITNGMTTVEFKFIKI
jgi:hypothetical protein